MAKIYGLTGVLTGKMGNSVFVVKNGTQVVRQYQPIVNNPKSVAQQFQRAKMNLAGRISGITPSEILVGLGGTKSLRRSRFMRLLMRSITSGYAAGSTTVINAKLLDEDYVFSEGPLVPYYSVTDIVSDATSVSLTFQRSSGVSAEMASSQGLLVVVVFKQADGGWEEVLHKFVTPDELSSGSFQVTISHRMEGAYVAPVYVAPFGTVDGSNLTTVTGELTSTSNSLDSILSNSVSASSLAWGRSFLISTRTFTPNA